MRAASSKLETRSRPPRKRMPSSTFCCAPIAAAISALYYNRAPVGVVDPEDAWGFLDRRIFSVEGIPLIRRPYRSFDSMHKSIKEFEREGCCCWIADPITLHWNDGTLLPLSDLATAERGKVLLKLS